MSVTSRCLVGMDLVNRSLLQSVLDDGGTGLIIERR